MTSILIEVSGGLVTNIMADGEVMVTVIDHDNFEAEDLSEEEEPADAREFQYRYEITTPEGLDPYIEDIIDRYKKGGNCGR